MALKSLLVALLAVPLIAAPIAQATPYTAGELKYVQDLKALHISDSAGDAHMIVAGDTVCDALRQGVSISELADMIYQGSAQGNPKGGGLTQDQAVGVVTLANQDICPEVKAAKGNRVV